MKCCISSGNTITILFLFTELFKFEIQKCGQILCAHKPYFLMLGHIYIIIVTFPITVVAGCFSSWTCTYMTGEDVNHFHIVGRLLVWLGQCGNMLNKNTLGVKVARLIRSSIANRHAGVTKKFDIN